MKSTHRIDRRTFLIASGVSAAALAGSGCSGAGKGDRQLVFASFGAALAELERLAKLGGMKQSAAWSWAQTLNHCAQSIEFSMSGFPVPKSAAFQNTLGAAAFKVFSWRGRMSHDLQEPIPGAPALDAHADAVVALQRLRAAIAAFQAFDKPLQAHFAYGQLSKADYEHAHAMHLANHFSAFDTPV
jgi:hypothetical protein